MNKHIMYFNISDIKAKGYLKNWQIVIVCTCEKTGQIETHTHTHRKMMHHSSNTHNRSIETELLFLCGPWPVFQKTRLDEQVCVFGVLLFEGEKLESCSFLHLAVVDSLQVSTISTDETLHLVWKQSTKDLCACWAR